MSVRRPVTGYTGHWSLDRFRDAMRARGIDPLEDGAGAKIAKRINDERRKHNEYADKLDDRTVRRWLSGEKDPSKPAGGRRPYIWEICRVFAIDPAWLMTGEELW